MFGAVAYGIEEGPQPLGVVTLQTQREVLEVEVRNRKKREGDILILCCTNLKIEGGGKGETHILNYVKRMSKKVRDQKGTNVARHAPRKVSQYSAIKTGTITHFFCIIHYFNDGRVLVRDVFPKLHQSATAGQRVYAAADCRLQRACSPF